MSASTGSSTNEPGHHGPRRLARAANTRRDIGIKRRYAAERRFRTYGLAAISFGLLFLFMLVSSVVSKGYTAFEQTMITIPVEFSESVIDKNNERATDPQKLRTANYPVVARNALAKVLGVDASDRAAMKAVGGMLSDSVRTQLRDIVVNNPSVIGTTQTGLHARPRRHRLRLQGPDRSLRAGNQPQGLRPSGRLDEAAHR